MPDLHPGQEELLEELIEATQSLPRHAQELTLISGADQGRAHRRSLSAIETGKANPTWATVGDIGSALGVSVSMLAKAAERFDG